MPTARAPTHVRKRLACDRCHSHKLRCPRREDAPCLRCEKAGAECIFSRSKRTFRLPAAEDRREPKTAPAVAPTTQASGPETSTARNSAISASASPTGVNNSTGIDPRASDPDALDVLADFGPQPDDFPLLRDTASVEANDFLLYATTEPVEWVDYAFEGDWNNPTVDPAVPQPDFAAAALEQPEFAGTFLLPNDFDPTFDFGPEQTPVNPPELTTSSSSSSSSNSNSGSSPGTASTSTSSLPSPSIDFSVPIEAAPHWALSSPPPLPEPVPSLATLEELNGLSSAMANLAATFPPLSVWTTTTLGAPLYFPFDVTLRLTNSFVSLLTPPPCLDISAQLLVSSLHHRLASVYELMFAHTRKCALTGKCVKIKVPEVVIAGIKLEDVEAGRMFIGALTGAVGRWVRSVESVRNLDGGLWERLKTVGREMVGLDRWSRGVEARGGPEVQRELVKAYGAMGAAALDTI